MTLLVVIFSLYGRTHNWTKFICIWGLRWGLGFICYIFGGLRKLWLRALPLTVLSIEMLYRSNNQYNIDFHCSSLGYWASLPLAISRNGIRYLKLLHGSLTEYRNSNLLTSLNHNWNRTRDCTRSAVIPRTKCKLIIF